MSVQTQEVDQLLTDLSTKMKVKKPRWTMLRPDDPHLDECRMQSWYSWRDGRFHVSPFASDFVIVHEFAHYVARFRGYPTAEDASNPWFIFCENLSGGAWTHGDPWCAVLVEVATAYYGDAHRYPWADETRASTRQWAVDNGYLAPELVKEAA